MSAMVVYSTEEFSGHGRRVPMMRVMCLMRSYQGRQVENQSADTATSTLAAARDSYDVMQGLTCQYVDWHARASSGGEALPKPVPKAAAKAEAALTTFWGWVCLGSQCGVSKLPFGNFRPEAGCSVILAALDRPWLQVPTTWTGS